MNATESGQRWCVRLLSIVYYFAIAPFLYDLFLNGARWRSAYLFPYILLGVVGMQTGNKENDRWVSIWFWVNLVWVGVITFFALFSPAFSNMVALYPSEKWIHLTLLLCSLFFFILHFLLPRKPMKSPNEEEDIEQGIPAAG